MVKVIMTHKQTIISCVIAMNVFNVNTYYLIFLTKDDMWELHNELWVKRSKVNLPATFWVHLFSDRISEHILVSSSSYFAHRFGMMKETCPESSPHEGLGVKSRMCPPYPQRDRKRRLIGAVCRNHRIKRVVPCRC